jgi:DNA-binding LytR/AlgR family response regulator
VLSDSSGDRILKHEEVAYIEGIGRYRRIHLTAHGCRTHQTDTIVSDTTLEDFEQQLSEQGFFRLHRGYIVKLDAVTRIVTESRRHFVQLRDVELRIPVSRNRLSELRALL